MEVQTSMVLQLVMDTLSQNKSSDVNMEWIQTARRTEIRQTLLGTGEFHVWMGNADFDRKS